MKLTCFNQDARSCIELGPIPPPKKQNKKERQGKEKYQRQY